jgi:hypothetical protein
MMAVFLVIKSLGGQTPDRGQRECDHPAITHHVRTTTKRCTPLDMRWKPVINAFAITFSDRWPATGTC